MSTRSPSSRSASAEEAPREGLTAAPFLLAAFWFAAGVLLSERLPLRWEAAAAATALHLALVALTRRWWAGRPFWIYAVFLLWGMAYPAEVLRRREALEASLPSSAVAVRLTVLSEPSRTGVFTRLRARVDRLEGRPSGIKVSCSSRVLPEGVRPGWRIEGVGLLEKDTSRPALVRDEYGTLELKFVGKVEPRRTWETVWADIRAFVRRAVTDGLPRDEAAVVEGLMLGMSPSMPVRVQEVFSNSGTMHLLAVSGLHLGIVAAVTMGLLLPLVARRPPALLVLALVVPLYALLVGERASVMRAALMAEAGILVWLLDRDRNYWNVLGLAALVLLVQNPFWIRNAGFQLSFAAVAGILAFQRFFAGIFGWLPPAWRPVEGEIDPPWGLRLLWLARNVWRDTASVSVAAQLAVLPLVLAHFHKAAFSGVFANLLAVPLSGAVIVTGFVSALLAALGLGGLVRVVNAVNGAVVRVLVGWVEWFSRWVYLRMEDPGVLVPLAVALGLAALFAALHLRRTRWLAWVFLAAALGSAAVGLAAPGYVAKVVVLSAGNGADAVVVRMRGRDLLFLDAPPERVERTLRPFMMVRSVRRFERVFVLSDRKEAWDGVAALADAVGMVQAERRPQALPEGMAFERLAASGRVWQADGLELSRTRQGLWVFSVGTNRVVLEPRDSSAFDAPKAGVLVRCRPSWRYEAESAPDMLVRMAAPEVTVLKAGSPKRLPRGVTGRVVDLLRCREVAVLMRPEGLEVKERPW